VFSRRWLLPVVDGTATIAVQLEYGPRLVS